MYVYMYMHTYLYRSRIVRGRPRRANKRIASPVLPSESFLFRSRRFYDTIWLRLSVRGVSVLSIFSVDATSLLNTFLRERFVREPGVSALRLVLPRERGAE